MLLNSTSSSQIVLLNAKYDILDDSAYKFVLGVG